ncbi:MAG: hypothetical protein LJE67_05040 [Salaquimonas sp.]|jgi:hypothetical protein|nr:hypothetical protein [Salaquimonas sp.]
MNKFIFVALCFFGVTAASSATAQELEDYINACIGGAGELSNEEVVAACTYLIDNAQAENETVGYFYAMRAISNSDNELNCSDGMKAKELVTDPSLSGAIDQIIENNC